MDAPAACDGEARGDPGGPCRTPAAARREFLTSYLPASLIIRSPLRDVRGPVVRAGRGGLCLLIDESRLRTSKVRWRLEQKPLLCNILGRFVRVSPKYRRRLEAGFADQAPCEFRLGLSQGVLEGRRCGVPT
jgi:hypothetical protein